MEKANKWLRRGGETANSLADDFGEMWGREKAVRGRAGYLNPAAERVSKCQMNNLITISLRTSPNPVRAIVQC